jgi:hypothetical protein
MCAFMSVISSFISVAKFLAAAFSAAALAQAFAFEAVLKSIATVCMRLIGSSFVTRHIRLMQESMYGAVAASKSTKRRQHLDNKAIWRCKTQDVEHASDDCRSGCAALWGGE